MLRSVQADAGGRSRIRNMEVHAMASVRRVSLKDRPVFDRPTSEAEQQVMLDQILAKKAAGQQLTIRDRNLMVIWGPDWSEGVNAL